MKLEDLMRRPTFWVSLTGLAIGLAALALTALGNPANMGFCVACFLRDISGALHLHSAAPVQYVRPEIIGLVLGATLMALLSREWKPRAGSSPATRFVLGDIVMVGALVFLGCPLRMILRMGGGDLNAFVGLTGFFLGILIGVFWLRQGFSLKRSYPSALSEGLALPVAMALLAGLVLLVPGLFAFSERGPGSQHAPVLPALCISLIIGALAQKSRLCMVGGMRDAVMFRDFHLLSGFVTIFAVVLLGNVVLGNFHGFSAHLQPIAHESQLWNMLGMVLVGWASVLLGGCPLRQLILAGEGNGDAAVTICGMMVGAAFSHNFGLAATAASLSSDNVYSPGGVGPAGKTAVLLGLAVLALISRLNTARKKDAA